MHDTDPVVRLEKATGIYGGGSPGTGSQGAVLTINMTSDGALRQHRPAYCRTLHPPANGAPQVSEGQATLLVVAVTLDYASRYVDYRPRPASLIEG